MRHAEQDPSSSRLEHGQLVSRIFELNSWELIISSQLAPDLDEMARLGITGTIWRQNMKVWVRSPPQSSGGGANSSDMSTMKEWVRATHQLFPPGLFEKELQEWTSGVNHGLSFNCPDGSRLCS